MDPFELSRFVAAQADCYAEALHELRAGQKRSHWMWFIFPQYEGLGFSTTARRYAIKSMDEARAYLVHPVLGPRLFECAKAVNEVEGRSARQIFGTPDDLKFCSSMTLFECAGGAANFPEHWKSIAPVRGTSGHWRWHSRAGHSASRSSGRWRVHHQRYRPCRADLARRRIGSRAKRRNDPA